jgi:hypothetical protein
MNVGITRHAAPRTERRGLDPAWTEPDPGDPSLTRAFRRIAAMDHRVLRVVFSRPTPTSFGSSRRSSTVTPIRTVAMSSVTVAPQADAAYLGWLDAPVVRTEEIGDGIAVD